MNSRARFLAACACRPLDRPPLWVMRQAGRYLPEYRDLKARHGFLKMVKTPALAAEVTLQPIRRFGFDAAILFSDILVIPEALGQPYTFRDEGGIAMEYALDSAKKIDALGSPAEVPARLAYVGEALARLKAELGGKTALLGFAGSPWTLATYMVEGGSSVDFTRVKALLKNDRPSFDALMEKLTAALVAYLKMQIEAGADAVQIFDSWGGVVAGPDYEAASLQWIRRIVAELPPDFPVILFAKGTSAHAPAQAAAGPRVLSFDATVDLSLMAQALPAATAVQGNLAPELLNQEPAAITQAATELLESMRHRPGHIVNLGHGILPEAKIASVEALVQTVQNWK